MNKKLNAIFLITAMSVAALSLGLIFLQDDGLAVSPPDNHSEEKTEYSYSFSFENGMEGWTDNGTDLDSPPVEWYIQPSQEMSTDGETAIELYLSNTNDAGKIWIERPFELEPNTVYEINVSYDFASPIFGDFNLWRIITGIHENPPREGGELIFQGDAGNDADSDVGYKWLKKSYDFTVQTREDNEIYVVTGIWGNWEVDRTYYLDNVQIEFVKENISDENKISENKAQEIAKSFVENSPTYKFDGENLKHKETLYPDIVDSAYTWTFVYEFISTHSGYGDRTGEPLLQVITPHTAHITVEEGEITQALLDLEWDMIEQKSQKKKLS